MTYNFSVQIIIFSSALLDHLVVQSNTRINCLADFIETQAKESRSLSWA